MGGPGKYEGRRGLPRALYRLTCSMTQSVVVQGKLSREGEDPAGAEARGLVSRLMSVPFLPLPDAVGQCGNQIGCCFWDLALREHAAVNQVPALPPDSPLVCHRTIYSIELLPDGHLLYRTLSAKSKRFKTYIDDRHRIN